MIRLKFGNRDKNNLILAGLCLFALFSFVLVPGLFTQAGLVMIGYVLCTIVFSMIPEQAFTMPCLVIRLTGLIRFVIFPITVYTTNNPNYYFTPQIAAIMLLEAVIVHTAILLYYRGKRYARKRVLLRQLEAGGVQEIIPIEFGVATLFVMIMAVVILVQNPQMLKNYFTFRQADKMTVGLNGALSLLMQIAFFIAFIYLLSWIQKKRSLPTIVRIILSFAVVIVYANGQGMTASNVSRWTILTSIVVGIIFILLLYPSARRMIAVMSVCVVAGVVVFSSLQKLTMWDNASSDTLISVGSLNSYFSGSKNIETGLQMLASTDIHTGKTIWMDTFANFPFLNQFVDLSYTTPTYFNATLYGNTISRDQICPMIIQCIEYFHVFGVIMYGGIVYLALHFYTISQCRRTMLEKNIYIILAFYFSLIFCFNWSVMLETLWIRVLPITIIHMLNVKIKGSEKK